MCKTAGLHKNNNEASKQKNYHKFLLKIFCSKKIEKIGNLNMLLFYHTFVK